MRELFGKSGLLRWVAQHKRGLAIGGAIAIALTSGTALRADSFDLDKANFSGYTGPFEKVAVVLNSSTTATVTFTSDQNSSYVYFMSEVGVNVNASSWTLGGISASNDVAGFTPSSYTDDGSGTMDGFGKFNQILKPSGSNGFSNSANSVSFTLTDTEVGGSWSSASDVLTGNDPSSVTANYLAAAHTIVVNLPNYTNANQTGFTTGLGGLSSVPVVPVPAAGWGGLVLLGIVGIGRKFRNWRIA